jgi:UDP-N-acetylmuramate dehydrogenase
MTRESLLSEVRQRFAGRLRENEPLRAWTTFHCGASAAAIVSPKGKEELTALLGILASRKGVRGKDWEIIGRGSNLLIRDGGFPGVLIDLSAGFSSIEAEKESPEGVRVAAEAGVSNGALLAWARQRSLGGVGWAYGIPGSLGGGIRMNAGTPLGSYSGIVRRVEGFDPLGRPLSLEVSPADFRYREFPPGRNLVITAASLLLPRLEGSAVEEEIEAARRKRQGQPIDLPNFGSVFKNPEGDFAGRLIEAAGLKGIRIGDAEISGRHANFIVNLGSARTRDVEALMERARREVRDRFRVELEPEVHLIGEEK